MTAIEGELMRGPDTSAFRCANCFYHEMADGVPYCNRRERAIKWDTGAFFCTEYGVGDNLDEWEERLFPEVRERIIRSHITPAPPAFSEFIECGAPRIIRPRQTRLDDWGAGA